MIPPTTPNAQPLAVAAILGLGVALRLLQYAASSSLWIDELYIALNVTRKDWGALLFGPLDHNQVAPFGFLALEKLATTMLGPSELALRLFPTLFSLVALFLFWRVSRRFLDGAPLYAALGLFAVNPIFLWTARIAKQYSGDIMVTLLLVYFALRLWERGDDQRLAWTAGILGGVSILLSQPAVLIGAGLLVVLLAQRARRRESLRSLMPTMAGWGTGAAVVTVTSFVLAAPATRTSMKSGWTPAFVKLPTEDLVSLPRLGFQYVAYLFGGLVPDTLPEIVLTGILTGVVLAGGMWLAWRRATPAILAAVPLVVAVLAATARLLPFSGRVAAYVGPTVLIAFGAGTTALRSALPRWLGTLGAGTAVALAALVACAQLLLIPPFYHRENARPVLEEIRARWQPGDIVYVLQGGRRAMEFYGEPMGLVPWVVGESRGFAPRALLKEVDAFRGRPRVWLFYTHARACEPEIVRSYLEAIGTRVEVLDDPADNLGKREAEAYLYDLSDPNRLLRSSAARHPVPRTMEDCEQAPESQAAIINRKLRALVP